jgi:tartrate dehydratase alpha subunit/fumarate hydratase class I-like protein
MKKKPTPEKTETKMISTMIPKDLMKRVKVFCDANEMTIKDFLADAITEKLELAHKERRKKSRL